MAYPTTDLRESFQPLDLAVEAFSAGLLVCDREGSVTYVNPTGAFTLGKEPGMLIGSHIESVVGDVGVWALRLDDVLAGEAQEEAIEGVWSGPNCTPLTISFSASPLRAASGAVAGAVILFRETSELDRLRRDMSRAEALASVGTLASGIAHQIRNPLAGIRSTVQGLLRKFSPGAKERDRLQRVLAEIDRVNGLIKSLLDFARPKARASEGLELGALLEDVLELAGPALEGARITTKREWGLAGARLRGDRQRLQEALLNLLLNAAEAMPRGGTLTVRVRVDRGGVNGPAGVEIEVSDTGPGIPPERAERIFQPFYTTKPGGTGLGLAVVRQVVEQHGGSVAVRSVPGQGATFVIRLPLPDVPGELFR